MGRRSNPVILAYFERGPKLADNSNRYPHRCKACGEDFPRGRIESLTTHLTKKCPAISEADKIHACLSLNGINNPVRRAQAAAQAQAQAHINGATAASIAASAADNTLPQSNWTALETLAEVSRQIDMNEKHDDHVPSPPTAPHDTTQAPYQHPLLALTSHPFELQEQFTLENPPLSYDNRPNQEQQEPQQPHEVRNHEVEQPRELTTEEKLHRLLSDHNHNHMESNLTMAAAATARLNPQMVDPDLHALPEHVGQEAAAIPTTPVVDTDANTTVGGEIGAVTMSTEAGASGIGLDAGLGSTVGPAPDAGVNIGVTMGASAAPAHGDEMLVDFSRAPIRPSTPIVSAPATSTTSIAHESISSWADIPYMPDNMQPAATVSDQSQQMAFSLNKGGFRMDTLSPGGTRRGHTRARFDATRRKEVQEVRRIGACIRCRILRKVCSKGDPCDTCRKVLSPRVWHTGCTRTKLAEQIDLYSAGVQVVVAQKRVNRLKANYKLSNMGSVIEASHYHETGHRITLQIMQGAPIANSLETGTESELASGEVIMIDNGQEDIPAQVENYMRLMLPEFISRETSSHVRVTLECAQKVARDTNDELLRRSLELWGLTEIMDRERQWSFLKKLGDDDGENNWLRDEASNNTHDNETFTTFCTQLTAGAERKAAQTSKNLLNGIQRNLQDGKTKLGFPMFLTAMIFLNCVEKMTWSFKAWEGEALQPLWPLEKQPETYYSQGYALCDLLKMLLHIRHILPKISAPDPDQPIMADEGESQTVKDYYKDLNVSINFLHSRREQFSFDQSDSRSLELLFCSSLLLP